MDPATDTFTICLGIFERAAVAPYQETKISPVLSSAEGNSSGASPRGAQEGDPEGFTETD